MSILVPIVFGAAAGVAAAEYKLRGGRLGSRKNPSDPKQPYPYRPGIMRENR